MVKRSDNFVEVGRVVYINYGPDAGKLATIIDVVDQSRALIDGPFSKTGVSRQTIPLRNLSLTPVKVNVPRAVSNKTLTKKWSAQKPEEKWAATNWAKKIAKTQLRASLSDFDRFKAMYYKKKTNAAVAKEAAKIRRAFKPAAAKPTKAKK